MSDIIEWHQAQQMPEERNNRAAEKLKEFLESDCELMNGRDLQYYVEETGKSLAWIIENGRNIHPTIKEAFYATGSMDDVWDYDPFSHYEPEDEEEYSEEEINLWVDQWKRDRFKVGKNQVKLEL